MRGRGVSFVLQEDVIGVKQWYIPEEEAQPKTSTTLLAVKLLTLFTPVFLDTSSLGLSISLSSQRGGYVQPSPVSPQKYYGFNLSLKFHKLLALRLAHQRVFPVA